eukprot:1162131-Pelagomonas_calceolata.AAC.22
MRSCKGHQATRHTPDISREPCVRLASNLLGPIHEILRGASSHQAHTRHLCNLAGIPLRPAHAPGRLRQQLHLHAGPLTSDQPDLPHPA